MCQNGHAISLDRKEGVDATQTASTKVAAPNRLKGKVAIITGGDQGNGQAIALRFAADGADIAFRYRSNRTEADDVVRSHSIWRVGNGAGTQSAL